MTLKPDRLVLGFDPSAWTEIKRARAIVWRLTYNDWQDTPVMSVENIIEHNSLNELLSFMAWAEDISYGSVYDREGNEHTPDALSVEEVAECLWGRFYSGDLPPVDPALTELFDEASG